MHVFVDFASLAWKRLFTLQMVNPMNETQRGTFLRESASFEPSCVKNRRRVWPVGEFPEKGINNNNFSYILPIRPEAPVDGCAPNLAQL